MGTRAGWVGGSYKILKYIGTCLLGDGGGKNWLKKLAYHQYGQNFISCVPVQPRISKKVYFLLGHLVCLNMPFKMSVQGGLLPSICSQI